MADLAALQVQLELQTAQFTQQMKTVNSQLDRLNNKVESVSNTFKKAGAALAGMVSVGTVIAVFKNAIDVMDDLRDSAQKLNTTTEELSAFQFAAKQSGVSIEQLSTGLGILSKNLADVEKGTTDAAKVLRAIGVTAGDTTTEAFTKIAEAFASLPKEANKTAIAMAVFGKSGKELIPLLNEGAEGIEKLTKRAAELGIVLDGAAADAADQFNDSLGEVEAGLQGIVRQMATGMLPALNGIAEGLANASGAGDGWITVGKGIGIVMNTLVAAAVALGAMFKNIANQLAGFAAAAAAVFSDDGFAKAGRILESLDEDTENLKTTSHQTIEALMTFDDTIKKTGDSTKKTATNTKLLADLQNALGTETDKTKKKTQEYTQLALTPLQQVLIDMNKAGKQRLGALEQLEFINKLSPEAIAQLGLTTQQFAEMQERLAKTAGIWTTLDEAMANIAKNKQAVADMSAAWDTLVEKLARGDITPEAFDELVKQLQKMAPAIDDASVASDKFDKSIAKLGESISTSIASNANNAMNDLIDSIGETEFSFTEMINSMLRDLAKLVTQLLIMQPLMESVKGFFGGGGGGMSSLLSAPTGFAIPASVPGIPTVGATAAFATSGFQSGGGNPSGNVQLGSGVQVNVYNNAGVEVSAKQSQGADGQQVIDMYIDRRINERFANGSMDKVMKTNFGLMRNAGA